MDIHFSLMIIYGKKSTIEIRDRNDRKFIIDIYQFDVRREYGVVGKLLDSGCNGPGFESGESKSFFARSFFDFLLKWKSTDWNR